MLRRLLLFGTVLVGILGVGWWLWRQPPPTLQAVMQRQARVLARAPQSARMAYSEGEALCAAGRYAEGATALHQAAQEAPQSALVHHNLGVAYAGLGRPQEALVAFRKAVQLEPLLAPSHVQMAVIQVQSGDYRGAEMALGQALRLDPNLEQARLLLSNARLMQGDAAGAEALAREAVRRQPGSFNAVMALGEILTRSSAPGASSQAVETLGEAVRLSNERTDPEGLAYRRFGEAALRVNRGREALQALETAVKRAPNDPASWYLLERAYRITGQKAKRAFAAKRAQQVLEWAREVKFLNLKIQEAPGNARLYFQLAGIERSRGNHQAAIHAYREGLARDPDAAVHRQALAALERSRKTQP